VSRALEAVTLLGQDDEDRPVFECLCDCGTTALVVVALPDGPCSGECAYTCDGCLTSHWMRLSVTWDNNLPPGTPAPSPPPPQPPNPGHPNPGRDVDWGWQDYATGLMMCAFAVLLVVAFAMVVIR
jgi:hypothetical protein